MTINWDLVDHDLIITRSNKHELHTFKNVSKNELIGLRDFLNTIVPLNGTLQDLYSF